MCNKASWRRRWLDTPREYNSRHTIRKHRAEVSTHAPGKHRPRLPLHAAACLIL
ncbi:unnamed protein product, partial [Symbiodinium microadriaticum]